MAIWPAGYALQEQGEVDSTNAEAIRRAGAGETGPLWISAARQTHGHGRRGNAWQSQLGNLFATLLIRPPKPLAECAQLSFAAALAVSDMLAGFAPAADIRLKWPNDVLAEGRKIAGLLLEAAPPDTLVIGIGVNLTAHPAKTTYGATSLADLGLAPPPPNIALQNLAASLAKWYELWLRDGFAPLREAWLARATGLGAPIRVRLTNKEISGIFLGVDETGALLLQHGGATHKIAAGEVYFPKGV